MLVGCLRLESGYLGMSSELPASCQSMASERKTHPSPCPSVRPKLAAAQNGSVSSISVSFSPLLRALTGGHSDCKPLRESLTF